MFGYLYAPSRRGVGASLNLVLVFAVSSGLELSSPVVSLIAASRCFLVLSTMVMLSLTVSFVVR